MNTKTKLYSIFHEEKRYPQDITFELIKGVRDYPEYIQEMIDYEWKIISKNNPYIYNEVCYSLISSKEIDNQLICEIQECSYKDFIGTNIKSINKITDTQLMANPLAACVVIITADKSIVVGKRSVKLAEGQQEWHIIGGTLEAKNQLPESPFELILKEIKEELNIDSEYIIDLHCTAMGRSFWNNKPEFLLKCITTLNDKQIATLYQSASHKFEHDCISFIKQSDFPEFIKNNKFSPIGIAALASADILD